MPPERTLYLVDGTYLLFRAYHSLPTSLAVTGVAYRRNRPELTELLRLGAGSVNEPEGVGDPAIAWLDDPSHDRLPSNAVRGLTSVLLKLLREERPTFMGIAFDLPGRVHRDDHYESFVAKHADYAPKLEGYKAYRPEMPIEIRVQYPLARLVCARALGIPLLEAEGFEADDLIGTLARRARGQGFKVRLVTADKDLFQLVDEGICVLNPHKSGASKGSSYHMMDAKVVEQEFGVPPSQVVDVLALMGDSSDNIPGVPGIGEKGAKDLIRRFGSVEACIEAARQEGSITRATYRQGLLEHAALALFSKELATIREDAPVHFDLERIWTQAPDQDLLRRIFGLLSFEALMRELDGLPTPGASRAELREPGEQEALLPWGGEPPAVPPPGTATPAVSAGSGLSSAPSPGRSGQDAGDGPASTHEGSVGLRADDEAASHRYRVVLDAVDLASLVPRILEAPRVGVHLETSARDPFRAEIVGIALAWVPHRGVYVPFAHRYLGAPDQIEPGDALRLLAPVLESVQAVKAGQDVKSQIEVLAGAGARPAGFHFDTTIAAFLLESDRTSYALGSLAKEYLADLPVTPAPVEGRAPRPAPFAERDLARASIEAGGSADTVLRLAEVLERRLAADDLRRVFDTIDMPLVEVLVAMETAGVRVDVDLLGRLSREMGEQIVTIRADIHRLAGREFNVDSPRQLAVVLFDEIGLQPVSRTAKSGVSSTRDEDLEILAAKHPLPARVRDYRVLAKLRSTYVDALPAMVNPATGRVHTTFSPTGAATGRLSSSDPNLQNIPIRTAEGRKIRAAFVPEAGWTLVCADYSQVELRVLAHLCGDPELIATFQRGEDIHRHTAARIFNLPGDAVSADQRRAAKTINFGILYGMGPQRLARDLSISQAEAKELIGSYFGRFPRIREYIDRTIEGAEQAGYVTTLFGRIRRFPHLISTSRFQRQLAIRAAVNSTIQGTAADLMKMAMIRLHRTIREKRLAARILIQVHDELVLEAPPEEIGIVKASIRDAMENVAVLEVPLTVDISAGSNWLSTKP